MWFGFSEIVIKFITNFAYIGLPGIVLNVSGIEYLPSFTCQDFSCCPQDALSKYS